MLTVMVSSVKFSLFLKNEVFMTYFNLFLTIQPSRRTGWNKLIMFSFQANNTLWNPVVRFDLISAIFYLIRIEVGLQCTRLSATQAISKFQVGWQASLNLDRSCLAAWWHFGYWMFTCRTGFAKNSRTIIIKV